MENNNKNMSVTAATALMVAGGILGAGIAMLYAPQSGERTRRDITRYGKRMKKRADETIDDLSERVNDVVENLVSHAEDLLEKGKDAAGSAKKDLLSMIEDGTSRLDKVRNMLSKAA